MNLPSRVRINQMATRSRTPEPPYCWQAKGAMRRIREQMNGDGRTQALISLYVAMCETASDTGSESFAAGQPYLGWMAGMSARNVQRIEPILEEFGLVKIHRPKLRGHNTYTLLTIRHGVATLRHSQFSKCRPVEITKKKQGRTAPPTPSQSSKSPAAPSQSAPLRSADACADDSDSAKDGKGESPPPESQEAEADNDGGVSSWAERKPSSDAERVPRAPDFRVRPASGPLSSAEAGAVVEAWNSAGGLPRVLQLSDGRKRKLAVRLKEAFFREHYGEAIKRIAVSSFCCGGGKNGWKADFDFLLKPDTVARTLEGRYDDPKPAAAESFI